VVVLSAIVDVLDEVDVGSGSDVVVLASGSVVVVLAWVVVVGWPGLKAVSIS
jgi:hypothetical protein